MISLKDKIAFITGASAGIGLACAEAFAAAGAKTILTARREEIIRKLSLKLKEQHKTDSLYYKLDVRNKHEIDRVVGSLPETWKHIDILVNNAGLAKGLDPIAEADTDDFDTMIDINIKGLLYTTRALSPGMIERGTGHIINLSSIAGHQVYHGGGVYCATKYSVDAITQALQIELVGTPVRVTSISPGMVETDFSMVRFKGDEARAKAVYQGLKPLSPEDIADAIVYCATRPPHVNINDMIIMPTNQANVYTIHKEL
ncbi:SDR family NAD(P)-dependent oxidoreductase [candidate division KSB1 bacterium]